MKRILKNAYIHFLNYSGLIFIRSFFIKNKLFLVGYHSISNQKNKGELMNGLYKNISVDTEEFERQIKYLKNHGHTFIKFEDLKNKKYLSMEKPTIIFFDDGFKDVLINASPILGKYKIPATVFLTTNLIDRKEFLWTMSVRYFLSSRNKNEAEVEKEISLLKKLNMQCREKEISRMFNEEKFNLNPEKFGIFLNWDEVRDLFRRGFEIGSHSKSHQKLVELDENTLRNDLIESKKIIEREIGSEISTVSYPYGRYDEKTMILARELGYLFGLSFDRGYNDFEMIDKFPFRLKRITPEPEENFLYFKARVYLNNF